MADYKTNMTDYKLIQGCTVEDAAKIARCNMTSFWSEAWWRMAHEEQDLERKITWATLRSPGNLLRNRDVNRHQYILHVPTGDIVGYSRWEVPMANKGDWLEAQTVDVSDEDRKHYEKVRAETPLKVIHELDVLDPPVGDIQAKHKPSTPHIVLDYLAVAPDHRRRGIAGMLVRAGNDHADALGLDVYLIATSRNALCMYKKQGYEVLGELVQSLKPFGADENWEVFPIIRRAKA